MLYYLLTGKRIYDFPPQVQKQLLMILEEEPVPIDSRRSDLPPGLAVVIHRALTRQPEGRYPDVTRFRDALLPFAAPHTS
jgi:serine/threonine-protein kinase